MKSALTSIPKIGLCLIGVAIVALIVAPASASLLVTYDFTTDDFGTPLVNGQHISTGPGVQPDTVFEFGNYSVVSTTQGAGGHLGAAIFDSDPNGPNSAAEDQDLLVDLGNMMILQDNERPGTSSGVNGTVFDEPDDEAAVDAGSIIFDFAATGASVMPLSIDIIDANGGFGAEVIMTDMSGDTRTYIVPSNWTHDATVSPTGYETLDLTETVLGQLGEGGGTVLPPLDVGSFNEELVATLEVKFTGDFSTSAGIDNLVFNVPEVSMIPEPTTALQVVPAAIAALSLLRRRAARKASSVVHH